MNIYEVQNGNELVLVVEGRLDTSTAPSLESKVNGIIANTENLVFDFSKLEYISSAGLRVLLSTQKVMNKQGKMVVKNVKPEIMEVFEITGFVDILTIE